MEVCTKSIDWKNLPNKDIISLQLLQVGLMQFYHISIKILAALLLHAEATLKWKWKTRETRIAKAVFKKKIKVGTIQSQDLLYKYQFAVV